jgi:phosphatidylglycerol lysyltransferase
VNRRQHLIGSIASVLLLLLLLAYGVQQRLRWAWALSAVLLCAGAVSVMLKGFAWEEAIALALLLLGLLPARREFHLSSSPPSQQYAAGRFVAVAVVLTTAWWLGLFS